MESAGRPPHSVLERLRAEALCEDRDAGRYAAGLTCLTMHRLLPYIRLKAPAGKCIRIRTDNYRGGSATNVFAEYRTCEGEQTFECKGWMNGHYVQYELPEGVEVLDVKYRETGCDTSFAGKLLLR